MASPEIGQRVVRSSSWSWREQDGGEGHLGTVVKLTNHDPVAVPQGWTRVRWDNGVCNNYQAGTGGYCDLLLFDNAPAGVVHSKMTCSSCNEDPIAGIRWKCCDQSCPDFNLCTPCYMTDEHDLEHSFSRFNSPDEIGTPVTPRSEEEKTVSMGLCPDAQVTKGEDWQGGEEDDDFGGVVVEVCPISERPRSGVTVKEGSGMTTTHRVGYDGKVDLKCTKPGRGIGFYATHLPILGKEAIAKVGDLVAVTIEADRLKNIQEKNGCTWSPRMKNLFAKIAKVTRISPDGELVITYAGREGDFLMHPDTLTRVPLFEKGDRVRVKSDVQYVKNLQGKSRNGWVNGMEKCLDKEGTVVHVDGHFDTWAQIDGIESSKISWHPCVLTLVEKSSDPAPHGEPTDISANDNSIEFQLCSAAKIGDLGRVSEILSSSPEKVNGKVEGKSALHKASVNGHLEVVKALIEAGADIEVTTDDGHTPLHYAVEGDEPVVTKYLLEKGADINRGSGHNRRAIHQAAYENHVDCARILINYGCDVNVQDDRKDTPFHDAIMQNSIDVAELLLAVPSFDTTLTNERDLTPLQFTALKDRSELAGMLAHHNPSSIPVCTKEGYSILHIAAVNDHVEVMKVILAVKEHGLCLDMQTIEGQTALHLAAHEGCSESVVYLVSLGAAINIQCNDGHSPLHLIASTTRRKPGEIKETPIIQKIRRKYSDRGIGNSAGAALLCFMVLHGASLDVENKSCRTPLYYIDDPKLKKTLKQIAQGDRAEEMKSLEDFAEDEDLKIGSLNINAISDDDVSPDEESPIDVKSEISANEHESTDPTRNQAKTNKPKIGVFELVHKIQVTELKMGPVVGKGQFGVVHRASWRGTPVAVKKISMVGSKKEEVEKEVAIHRQATHPNIVKMMALGYDSMEAYLVMEFIEGVSLRTIIFPDRDDPQICLDWFNKLRISREILQAATFMHACNILHLDIKPSNIIVETATNRSFVCDLGLAHIKSRNAMSQSLVVFKGTPNYMPPEAIAVEPGYRYSSKHDIWSIGGTLVELFSLKRLWGDCAHPMALVARAMAGNMGKPEALEYVDLKVREILELCFCKKPDERPSAEELLDKFNALS